MATFETCFKGKRVLITGAGKGIGRALSVKLSQLGATVYAVSRTKADLDNLTAECPTVQAILLDISDDWDKTRSVVAESIQGPIDILVNNAAVVLWGSIMDCTSDQFDNLIGINLKALVNMSQICAQKMIDSGKGGTIIIISAGSSIKPHVLLPIYSASKAGVDSLTKTMAMEFGKHQIKVVAMNLGFVWSNIWETFPESHGVEEMETKWLDTVGHMLPLGKVFIPVEQVVDSILFVASGSVDMMTGNGFILDGGITAS